MGRPVEPDKIPTFLTNTDETISNGTSYRKHLEQRPVPIKAPRTKVYPAPKVPTLCNADAPPKFLLKST